MAAPIAAAAPQADGGGVAADAVVVAFAGTTAVADVLAAADGDVAAPRPSPVAALEVVSSAPYLLVSFMIS